MVNTAIKQLKSYMEAENQGMSLAEQMNRRVRAQATSDILQFNAEISQIQDIVKLTLGEPDFATPDHIKAAAVASIEADQSHYLDSRGLLQLRQAASDFFADQYGTRYDPERELLVTAGATGGIYSSLTAMLNQGDTVFIPTPIFPLYFPITQLAGGHVVSIDTSADGFMLTPEKLQRAIESHRDSAKVVILNYPSNPTGVTYTQSQLKELGEVAKQYGIFVLSDEIYSELTYVGKHVSMGEVLPEQSVVLNGVSKSHAMTGWRIGTVAGPADVITEIAKVSEFTITCVTANAQYAAAEAFSQGRTDAQTMKNVYMDRRDFMLRSLRNAGLRVVEPQGAFYLFLQLPERMRDSWKFAYGLAREGKVAVIPGASFGAGGDGYVRISYAASMEDLRIGVDRIIAYMEAH